MSSNAIALERGTLSDLLEASLVRDLILVVAYAVALGLSAQVSIHLSFTPVPITGQTLAVLGGAAAIGPMRSLIGSTLYLIAGLVGVPWFANGSGGFGVASSPTFGYLVGFLAASLVVGYLASKGLDRHVVGMAVIMVLGNVVIYAFGVTWLSHAIHVSLWKGISLGLTPFLIGDAIKLLIADAAFPSTWAAIAHRRSKSTMPKS